MEVYQQVANRIRRKIKNRRMLRRLKEAASIVAERAIIKAIIG